MHFIEIFPGDISPIFAGRVLFAFGFSVISKWRCSLGRVRRNCFVCALLFHYLLVDTIM